MRSFYLVLLLIIGCGGVSELSNEGTGTTTDLVTVATTEETGTKETKETDAIDTRASYSVAAKADLWECKKQFHRQLVYVEETAGFVSCSPSLNEWVSVSIKGDKGIDGLIGKDGVAGVVGASGAKGDKGDKGDTGEDGTDAENPIVAMYRCGSAGDGSGVFLTHASAVVYKNGMTWIEAFFAGSTSFRLETCSALSTDSSVTCNTTSYSSTPVQAVFDKSAGTMTYKNNGYNDRNTSTLSTCVKGTF